MLTPKNHIVETTLAVVELVDIVVVLTVTAEYGIAKFFTVKATGFGENNTGLVYLEKRLEKLADAYAEFAKNI